MGHHLLCGRAGPRRPIPLAASVAIAIALAVVLSACSAADPAGQGPEAGSTEIAADDVNLGPTDDELNTISVFERFGPSTASLSVVVGGQQMLPEGIRGNEPPNGVLPPLDGPARRSSGSGFLIDIDGSPFVVSNFHVVQATLEAGTSNMVDDATIGATFGDDESDPIPLRVVGVNPSFDLALLELAEEDVSFPDVAPIPIADSDLVVPGQKTIAVGNPFGLGATLTTGTVSSTGRFIESIGQVSVPMIQTDAAINPGNSGGALLNSSGQLIGVNTAIFNPGARSFAGIGFAVPSNLLVEAMANLELGGVSTLGDTRVPFGARLGTLSLLPPMIRGEAGLPATGVAVLDVVPDGPAATAGLRVPEFVQIQGISVPVDPDVITEVDGKPIETAEELNIAITYEAEQGQEVELTILRDGDELTVPVVVGN